jgi:O-antigen/teichoic acid export membrane protein
MSWTKIKEVLAYGAPLVPGGVAALVLTLCDRYFLKHFATMEDVGLYSVGFRVASVLRIAIIEPFRIAWPPYMLSVVERAEAKDIYKKVFVYFAFIAVWAGLVLSLFAQEGLRVLTTPAYYAAYRVVPLLALSYILFGMCAVLVAGIHIAKKTKYASYSFVTAALISLLMNYLLVPRLGMMGAALASVTAYVALSILYFTMSQRFYRIEHEFGRVALIFAAGLALYALSLIATAGRAGAIVVVMKIACALLYPVLLYLGGFFRKEELARIRELSGLGKGSAS